MGFVFIEANVKKWGLAPMTGSLAPPPPYGSEQGSILLETGREGQREQTYQPGHSRTRSGLARLGLPGGTPAPPRTPTDISLAQLAHVPSQEFNASAGTSYMDLSDVQNQPIENTPSGQQIIPPPEYTSPPGSRRSTQSRGGGNMPSGQQRGGEQPPIPSYDAAVGERGEPSQS